MKAFLGALVASIAISSAATAQAFGVGTPVTYSKLQWSTTLTAPGLTSCTNLTFDATGDLTRSDTLVLAGALNCPGLGGGYGFAGTAYASADGTLNVTVLLAGGYTITCARIVAFAGNCTVFDSSGFQRGTGFIRLL